MQDTSTQPTVAALARRTRAKYPHLDTAVGLRDQLLQDYPELADRAPAVLHNAARCALLPPPPPRGTPAAPPLHNLTQAQITHLLTLLPNGSFDDMAEMPTEVYPAPYEGGNMANVLVIGDLHAPFIREGYLEFCRAEQERLDCGRVIFIGDIADNHAISFHISDPDGMSAGDEHAAALKQLQKVFAMFPVADSMLGNHCLLIARKAQAAGLSQRHVRSVGEIYGAPAGWRFLDEVEYDDVVYSHGGAGGNALRVAQHSRRSCVQGHRHSEFFVQWLVSQRDALFAVQCGCGVDDKAYAFAYGRPFPKKSAVGCAAILDSGKRPMTMLMPL